MPASGGGVIIDISTISGEVGPFVLTNYSAAQAGIVRITERSSKGTPRSQHPRDRNPADLIRTPMGDALGEDLLKLRLSEIPPGRIGELLDVANAAVFLASDFSSHMTAAILEVACGRQGVSGITVRMLRG
jgi:3-oxoacyl-[acyl-carrier protein] reductase